MGDIESMVFLEALRQLRFRVGVHSLCWVHVSLVLLSVVLGSPRQSPRSMEYVR